LELEVDDYDFGSKIIEIFSF